MAGAAEALQLEPFLQPTVLPELIDADTIPGLRFSRRRAAQEAQRILAENQQLVETGQPEAVPIRVDVLGTAQRVVEAEKKYGKNSPQYRELNTGLVLDCERVIGEAERKLTWEYFGDAVQTRDHETGHYSAHGVPLPEVVTGGLSPFAKPEEQGRRINEYVEEVGTYTPLGRMAKNLGGMAVGETIKVLTTSECTDSAIAEFKLDPKGTYDGYVPEIGKFMVREVEFAENERIERQLGLSGIYITRQVIMTVLAELGVINEGQELTKTELHGKQLIDTASRGVLWFAELLDQEASRQSGKRIFMGEIVADVHPMDYENVPIEAEARRVKLAPKPQELADYLIGLEKGNVNHEVAEGLVNAYLKKTLLVVAKADPDKAEVMFDKATAEGFRTVARLEALGHHQEARQLQAMVEENAPPVIYCGAGSCGLENASNAADVHRARELGLSGELLHDTDRSCPSCNAMKVYYDTNGNKACTGCGNREIH